MYIKIKDKGFRLSLYVPLALIKCKFIYKNITKKNTQPVTGQPSSSLATETLCTDNSLDAAEMQKLAAEMYKALKQYKKEFGSFTLVDVNAADGAIVKIVI
ncbi:MAG: hypothetical protein EOM87_00455 [Clostridia bacterium]|nr:hypothetical protein [Clostridia bacterium]